MTDKPINLSDFRNGKDAKQFQLLQAEFLIDLFTYENRRHAETTEELDEYIRTLKEDGVDLSAESPLFKGWLIRRAAE